MDSRRTDRDHDRGGFTTLGVPLFFVLLYALTLCAGLAIALPLAPIVFVLALTLIPPPKVIHDTPAYVLLRARREARRAARKTKPPPSRAYDPARAPIFDPAHGGIVRLGRHFMPDATRPGAYLLARRRPAQVLVLPSRDDARESPKIAAA